MKKYLLLRDNRKSGPHTMEQLASIALLPLDLVWIEDESTSWQHPHEIEELKNLPVHNADSNIEKLVPGKTERIFVSLPSNFSQKNRKPIAGEYSSLPVNETGPVLETNYTRSYEELKENYKTSIPKAPVWKKRMFPSTNAAAVAAIFLGVVLGAFIVKKWVDGYEPASLETASAMPVIDRETQKQPEENIKNALVTEIVPVYKNLPAKTTKKVNLKKHLQVRTNDYKVGLFGGINGLQLTLFNNSPQVVDKVIVALDYLKHNGSVIQSENIAFTSIKPKSAQTIAIPGSNRGVKLKYKIVRISARAFKADLKQI